MKHLFLFSLILGFFLFLGCNESADEPENTTGLSGKADGIGDCPLTGIMCTRDCPASGRTSGGAPCKKGVYNTDTCECQQICGGFAGIQCQEGYTCKLAGQHPDELGHCEKEETPSCESFGGYCTLWTNDCDASYEPDPDHYAPETCPSLGRSAKCCVPVVVPEEDTSTWD